MTNQRIKIKMNKVQFEKRMEMWGANPDEKGIDIINHRDGTITMSSLANDTAKLARCRRALGNGQIMPNIPGVGTTKGKKP